jgi:hypothetical protein
MKLIEGKEYIIGDVNPKVIGTYSHEDDEAYYFSGLLNHPIGFLESDLFPGKIGFIKKIRYVLKP